MSDELYVYVEGTNRPLHKALEIMCDDWIDAGQYCDQTVLDICSIMRLLALLEPCRSDTDAQTDADYPRTVNDVLSLLSSYIVDCLPDEAIPSDEYLGAWERQARPVIERIMAARAAGGGDG